MTMNAAVDQALHPANADIRDIERVHANQPGVIFERGVSVSRVGEHGRQQVGDHLHVGLQVGRAIFF